MLVDVDGGAVLHQVLGLGVPKLVLPVKEVKGHLRAFAENPLISRRSTHSDLVVHSGGNDDTQGFHVIVAT